MLTEVRQYLWVRLTVLGTGLVIVASLVIASVQLWPVVQHVIAPTKLACGCAVVSVMTPWWMTTISGLIIAATVFLVGLMVKLFLNQLYRSHQQERRLWLDPVQTVVDDIQKVSVNIVDSNNLFAMTVGFWRPSIFVSRSLLQQLSPSEYQAVLTHERAHQRSHDPLLTALMSVCSSAFGFLPGARDWMSAAYSLRELAADAVATDGYQQTEDLSSAFVKLSSATVHPAISAFSPNRDRLEKLLNHNWRRPWRWWHWSAGIIAAGIMMAVLGFGHFATAKSPAVPTSAAAACHETMIMCRIEHLPELPSAWICTGGRCLRALESWSPFYVYTPVR